jgi:glutaminyl-peptide cyclotransferase
MENMRKKDLRFSKGNAEIKSCGLRRLGSQLSTLAVLTLLLVACSREESTAEMQIDNIPVKKTTPVLSYRVINVFPHDSSSFTEGFLFHNGVLYESSGAPDNLPATRSMFGTVDLKTGKIDKKGEIDRNKYFGEGIVILNGKLYQLTWQGQTGFIYDAKTFKNMGTFGYMSKEGWGITTDGRHLIMSDGTNALTFINPDNFQISKTIMVSENNYAVDRLNELEYINGYLYANVWMKDVILKIDPESGEVVAKLDLGGLVDEVHRKSKSALELNGIAFDTISDRIMVTGKMWPAIYQIDFAH